MRYFHLIIISLLTILISSCGNNKKVEKEQYLPTISGKEGDVLVIIENKLWENPIGASIRSILSADYPYLPQDEPIFNVFSAPHSTFNGTYRFHRNIFVLEILPNVKKSTIRYLKNEWAKPQAVIAISAKSQKDALTLINTNQDKITNFFETAERERVINIAKKYNDANLQKIVANEFGGSPYIPMDFSLKKHVPGFIWISYETTYVNQGILMYKYPYSGPKDLTVESIINKRNLILGRFVPGMRLNSFMTTSTLVNPGIRKVTYHDFNITETRGLWELENDYMGGPFISHSFLSKDKKEVIVMEVFVYAPKFNKLNYLRHIESIIYSFKWNNISNNIKK
ncbi:MAG: DUF4837 family protein [Bacteroidales bacterium]